MSFLRRTPTGTVTYTYNGDSTLATKTDAKNQKVEYVYDAYKRVTEVKRYPVAGGAEDTCQKTKYFYDVNTFDGSFSLNAWGRLVVSEYPICSPAGLRTVREMYSYTEAGLVTKKRFRVDTQKDESPGQGTAGSAQLDASWTYDTERRTLRRRIRRRWGCSRGPPSRTGSTRWGGQRG